MRRRPPFTTWLGLLWAGAFLHAGAVHATSLKPIKVSIKDKLSAPRWLHEGSPKPEKGAAYELFTVKKFRKERKFEECVKQAKKSEVKNTALRPWLLAERMECAAEAYRKNKKNLRLVNEAIAAINKEREWLYTGPYVARLRETWVDNHLIAFEEQSRANRAKAWQTFGALEQVSAWMTRERRAVLYKQAGELAFQEQRLSSAVYFFEKSLDQDETSAVRQRWLSVRNEYYRSLKKEPPAEPQRPAVDETVEASVEELEIYNRMREAMKVNDYVSAVEDGIKLIREFPGGRRAQFATKQILSIYLALAQKSDEKFIALKTRVLELMGKADGARLYEWAQTLVAREYFADAIVLSQNSLEQVGGQPVSTKVLLLMGQSALHLGDLKNARKAFEKLIREHSGTKAAMEAVFRLGLILFREGSYAESAAYFEKYLALRADFDYEISSLYWLWRAQQRLKNADADNIGKELVRRYPLSYFGLRARYELNQDKLQFNGDLKEKPNYTAEVWATPHEYAAWERFNQLLRAGWLAEAQAELEMLPEPSGAEGLVVWAWLWGLTLNYQRTFEILQRVWQADPNLLRPAVLKIAYPQEFYPLIEAEAKKYKLPPQLVLSLMRQESSFRPGVQSPAGAMGLMQVMPMTGREIATDLRIKLPNFPDDLYTADINVRIGTNYLYRLMKTFEGHVPLALAAYNAGIGNVRGWLNGRSDLASLKSNPSSQIDAEIWFDELPWLETSGYIKSILRNWILYRYLEKGEVQFSDPLWRI